MTEAVACESQLEQFLSVGAQLLIEIDPDHLDKSTLLGWQKDVYIMIDWPVRQKRLAPLTVGKKCSLRFLGSKYACAFETTVADYRQSGGESWCWLRWPLDFKLRPFRQFERFPICLPCHFRIGDSISGEGEILDLSLGGCCLMTDTACNPGDRVLLDFRTDFGTIQGLQAEVKNKRFSCNGMYRLGCEILPGQDVFVADISYYLSQRLRGGGGAAAGQPIVAIMAGTTGVEDRISNFFREAGWECLICPTAFDLLSRLKLVGPAAVLIFESPDLPLANLVLLLRHSPGLDTLPIFVCGRHNETLPDGVRSSADCDDSVLREIVATR